jgi:SAM-dependent methyltransferase
LIALQACRGKEKTMSEVTQIATDNSRVARTRKDRSCLLNVIRHYLDECGTDRSQSVLVVGGGQEDQEILSACGFQHIVLSNLDNAGMVLDAEDIALPEDSYPLVFAHAVLHHCRSPHKAVGELVRVSQKHVFFVEPNDSLTLRLLVRLGFSFPYELAAVADNGYTCGGMRNGPVPNYIYRWTGREVQKSVAAYQPERQLQVRAHPYWDFYVNEYELLARKETRVAALAEQLGARNLVTVLHLSQMLLNLFPPLRSQGNKFFCAITKRELQPWIEMRDGHHYLKKETGHASKIAS